MLKSIQFLVLAMGLALAPSGTVPAGSAQTWNQSDQQILNQLDRLTRDARQFDRVIDAALGRDADWMNPNPVADDIDQLVIDLTDTARHLRDHVTRRQVVEYDVQEVMIRGTRIDEFMRKNRFSSQVETSWLTVRRELDDLAKAFDLKWDWNRPTRQTEGPT